MGLVALQSEPSEAEGSQSIGTRQAQAKQGSDGTVPPACADTPFTSPWWQGFVLSAWPLQTAFTLQCFLSNPILEHRK